MTASIFDGMPETKSVQGVTRSAEYRRIQELPRRALDVSAAIDLTPIWRRDDARCPGCDLCRRGAPKLRPVQSTMLAEAERAQGLLAPVGVGCGKELTCLLLPDALQSRRAVILTKSRLKRQMIEHDHPRYSVHFRLRPLYTIADLPRPHSQLNDQKLPAEKRRELLTTSRFEIDRVLPEGAVLVISYSELQHAAHCSILMRLCPLLDLIVSNEAHSVANRRSARGRRFIEPFREHPHVRLCALSGTMTEGMRRYAHLSELALRRRSPVPSEYRELDEWARAVDVQKAHSADSAPVDPGALLDLCGPAALADELDVLPADQQELFCSEDRDAAPVRREVGARIFGRRLRETAGVVVQPSGGDCEASLTLSALALDVPKVITDALAELRRTWSIGGDDLAEAAQVAAKARQLACGFYYRWAWPDGHVDVEWLETRSAWRGRVRHILQHQCRSGMDSELLVRRAAERGEVEASELEDWIRVEDRPAPPIEAVWLSDFFLDACVRWTKERAGEEHPGIVWYQHAELAPRLEERGLRVFYPGDDSLLSYRGPHAVASVLSYSDGLNLQHFPRGLVTTPMGKNQAWEQAIGRSHRPGQEHDEVAYDVAVHDESLRSILAGAYEWARRVADVEKSTPKLVLAQKIGLDFLNAGR